MQNLAQNLGIYKNTIWTGTLAHKDVMEYYKKTYCIVVPSKKEPFSTVALEGMSFVVPVICSNVGGFNEMIIDQIDGLLFESGNPIDLSNKISSLIKSPYKRVEIAASAVHSVKNKFSWRKNGEKTINLYKKIIENRL